MQSTVDPHYVSAKTEPSPDELLHILSTDFSVELFHEIVMSAYDPHVNSLTRFAPLDGKNSELRIHAIENLRSRLCAAGWEKSDLENTPCVYSLNEGIRLTCTTDGGPAVGKDYPSKPMFRVKGHGTLRLAGCQLNTTMQFPGFEDLFEENEPAKMDDLAFYYLLMHIDGHNEEIRLELSRPLFNKYGFVDSWADRIILPPISISSDSVITKKSIPAPKIDIVRKVS